MYVCRSVTHTYIYVCIVRGALGKGGALRRGGGPTPPPYQKGGVSEKSTKRGGGGHPPPAYIGQKGASVLVCPTNKLVNNNSRKLQGASFRDL